MLAALTAWLDRLGKQVMERVVYIRDVGRLIVAAWLVGRHG